MKQPSSPPALSTFFSDIASSLATTLPAESLAALAAWLAPSAHRLGLTNYSNPLQLAENLVAPALRLLSPNLRPYLSSPALDFGPGSGAVGLSLALCAPDLQVLLADRRRRVIEFLDLAIRRFDMPNAHTLLVDLGRPPPPPWQHRCGSVLIRAYGPTALALDQALAWLRPEGAIALWHQPPPPAPPDGSILAVTERTSVPSLALTIYRRS